MRIPTMTPKHLVALPLAAALAFFITACSKDPAPAAEAEHAEAAGNDAEQRRPTRPVVRPDETVPGGQHRPWANQRP